MGYRIREEKNNYNGSHVKAKRMYKTDETLEVSLKKSKHGTKRLTCLRIVV